MLGQMLHLLRLKCPETSLLQLNGRGCLPWLIGVETETNPATGVRAPAHPTLPASPGPLLAGDLPAGGAFPDLRLLHVPEHLARVHVAVADHPRREGTGGARPQRAA